VLPDGNGRGIDFFGQETWIKEGDERTRKSSGFGQKKLNRSE